MNNVCLCSRDQHRFPCSHLSVTLTATHYTDKKCETLTLISIITKGVEYSHSDVDQTGQVEGDAPPKRDVA